MLDYDITVYYNIPYPVGLYEETHYFGMVQSITVRLDHLNAINAFLIEWLYSVDLHVCGMRNIGNDRIQFPSYFIILSSTKMAISFEP